MGVDRYSSLYGQSVPPVSPRIILVSIATAAERSFLVRALRNGRGDWTRLTIAPGRLPTPECKQATVNLFADMGVQPATFQSGLVAATQSTT